MEARDVRRLLPLWAMGCGCGSDPGVSPDAGGGQPDAQLIDELARRLGARRPVYRSGGIIMLAVAVILGLQSAPGVRDAEDALWLATFLLATILPGVYLLRKGWRDPRRHPLMIAVTEHPEWIEAVELAYEPTFAGGRRARLLVRLGAHGRATIWFDEADGRELVLADFIRGRRGTVR